MLSCNERLIPLPLPLPLPLFPFWDTAEPAFTWASGGAILTVRGFFPTLNYTCSLLPSAAQQTPVACSPIANQQMQTELRFSLPVWQLAAQDAIVQIADATTRKVLKGPGGASEKITIMPVWTSKSAIQGAATGGTAQGSQAFTISGLGFDRDSSNYVCKFIRYESSSPTADVAQTLPFQPMNSAELVCSTPTWSFEGSTGDNAGKALVLVEKGGQVVMYQGVSSGNEYFFSTVWRIDGSSGYSSPGQTITIQGYGFGTLQDQYLCSFESTGLTVQSQASSVSPSELHCVLPGWTARAQTVDLTLYKVKCRGINYEVSSCKTTVQLQGTLNSRTPFQFLTSIHNYSASTSYAAKSVPSFLTVHGGGFDGGSFNYTVEIKSLTDSSQVLTIPVRASDVSGSSITVTLSEWIFTPNILCSIIVFQGSQIIPNVGASKAEFTFTSMWSDYQDGILPLRGGASSGNEVLTIFGNGFVFQAQLDQSEQYFCTFSTETMRMNASRSVVISSTEIACTTPDWGAMYTAMKTVLSLHKGNYTYPNTAEYEFSPSWSSLSITYGSFSGGETLSVFGSGLNISAKYRCKFSFNEDEVFAWSDEVYPYDTTKIVFTTPRWQYLSRNNVRIYIFEGDKKLINELESDLFAGIIFRFVVGVLVSAPRLVLQTPDVGHLFLRPDTFSVIPIVIHITSSDSQVANATGDVSFQRDDQILPEGKQISVYCLRPGAVSLVLTVSNADGSNNFANKVTVVCSAGFRFSSPQLEVKPSSPPANVTLTLDSEISQPLRVEVTSGNLELLTVSPLQLTFNRSNESAEISAVWVGAGATNISVRGVTDSGNLLFAHSTASLGVRCEPEILFSPSALRLNAGETIRFSVELRPPPTLPVTFRVLADKEGFLEFDRQVSFGANITGPKEITVKYVKAGQTTLRLVAESPGMLSKLSSNCSTEDARRCSQVFANANGCDFSTLYTSRDEWNLLLTQLSHAAGVQDCSSYFDCLRVSCCSSPPALTCSRALQDKHCSLDLILPRLSKVEDASYDFGVVPLDSQQTLKLYQSWTPNLNCMPFVPCAWSSCFPGNGNYDGMTSHAMVILSLPSLSLDLDQVHLQQGGSQRVTVSLDIRPSAPVLVKITIVNVQSVTSLPVAVAHPSEIVLQGSSAATFDLTWAGVGRADVVLTCSGGAEYENVSRVHSKFVTCLPGIELEVYSGDGYKQDLSTVMTRANVNVSLAVAAGFTLFGRVDVGLQGSQGTFLQPAHFSLSGPSPVLVHLATAQTGSFSVDVSLATAGAGEQFIVASQGLGYTSGEMSIVGYGGRDFAGRYEVGVIHWDYYYDRVTESALRGSNYSLMGADTFSMPPGGAEIAVERCMKQAAGQSIVVDGVLRLTGHTGIEVKGCQPKMNFSVDGGSLSHVSFESGRCIVTGLTCAISLQGYGGSGFHGYFQTGFANFSINSNGTGYDCSLGCLVNMARSPLAAAEEQTCALNVTNCTDGYVGNAVVVFGNVISFRPKLLVVVFPDIMLSPASFHLGANQTALIQVRPLETVTAGVSFNLSTNSSFLHVQNFRFETGDNKKDANVSFVIERRGGSSGVASLLVQANHVGNYAWFRRSLVVTLMPDFKFVSTSITLQRFPGQGLIQIAPDTSLNKDTLLHVEIVSDFGQDWTKINFGRKILLVPDVALLKSADTGFLSIPIEHGGSDSSSIPNIVSGTAVVRFFVNDTQSNYNGVGLLSPSQTVAVSVKPGFHVSFDPTRTYKIQRLSSFEFSLKLDFPADSDLSINLMRSFNMTMSQTGSLPVRRGDVGPFQINVPHDGSVGLSTYSLIVSGASGNYAGVTAMEVLKVSMLPGLVLSVPQLELQYSRAPTTFTVRLDTQPTEDVMFSVENSNPSVLNATGSIFFPANSWDVDQVVAVTWIKAGRATLSFKANSPGGNYQDVACCDINIVAYPRMFVSQSDVLLQKNVVLNISVGLPTVPSQHAVVHVTSLPEGIVSVDQSLFFPASSSSTMVLSIRYLSHGKATLSLKVTSADSAVNGVVGYVYVDALPGFTFSQSDVSLYSCPRTLQCNVTIEFFPDLVPDQPVTVLLTSSDPSVATLSPDSVSFLPNSTSTQRKTFTIFYRSPGFACVSFAATSLGNYNDISSGGVNVRALPDFRAVGSTFRSVNSWETDSPFDFDVAHPAVYVQNQTSSNITITLTEIPSEEVLVMIVSSNPDIVSHTSSLRFPRGSLTAQTITVTFKRYGSCFLSLYGQGGNYEGAKWEQGISVKALPTFLLPERITLDYHSQYSIVLQPSVPLVGDVNVSVTVELPDRMNVITPIVSLRANQTAVAVVQHVNPDYTKIKVLAYGPGSNYNYVEQIIIATLNYPGFSLSATTLHVQRWFNGSIIGPVRGQAELYLTPNFASSASIVININNQNQNIIAVTEPSNFQLEYPTNSIVSKLVRVEHKGIVGRSVLAFGTPATQGIIMPIPLVTVLAHAGFSLSQTAVTIQRKGNGKVTLSLDTPPQSDTTIFFSSSNPAILSVQQTVVFYKSETIGQTVRFEHISPGLAYINFVAQSQTDDYNGAAAYHAVAVTCKFGLVFDKSTIYVPAPPTAGGLTTLAVALETPSSTNVTLHLASSDESKATLVNPTVFFVSGSTEKKNISISYVASSTASNPVFLTVTLETAAGSVYSNVSVDPVPLVSLGKFLFSSQDVFVQKGRSIQVEIWPNVPPDSDVTVSIQNSNSTIAQVSGAITFLAGRTDRLTFTVVHRSFGSCRLSFTASSKGNFFGVVMDNAVNVTASYGFRVFEMSFGTSGFVPGSEVQVGQVFKLQAQQTSPLSRRSFFIATDVPVTSTTRIVVVSSNTTCVVAGDPVILEPGGSPYKTFQVRYGLLPCSSVISFRAETTGNYLGVESGALDIVSLPSLTFSSVRVNVQYKSYGFFSVSLSDPPTSDVNITVESSDPTIASFTSFLVFSKNSTGPPTAQVMLTYISQGSFALSFSAAGGNYDGLQWDNAVLGLTSPGLIFSSTLLQIGFDASMSFSIRPDTVPTEVALLYVTSSQPVIAEPLLEVYNLSAGTIDNITITVRSTCSSSPSFCIRTGSAFLSFRAVSNLGNYDAMENLRAVEVRVRSPGFDLSVTSINLQRYPGSSVFYLSPRVLVNVDTVVFARCMDETVCLVQQALVMPAGSDVTSKFNFTVSYQSVGQTFVRLTVENPQNSIYFQIDPIFIPTTAYADLTLSPDSREIKIQPYSSYKIQLTPSFPLVNDILVEVVTSNPSIVLAAQSTFSLSASSQIVGLDVYAAVGMRVILTADFQTFPRTGPGTITYLLNENLDVVLVDWDEGPKNQTYFAGYNNQYMLARYQSQVINLELLWIGFGIGQVDIRIRSKDFVYDRSTCSSCMVVTCLPPFLFNPPNLILQSASSATVLMTPATPVTANTLLNVQTRIVVGPDLLVYAVSTVQPSSLEILNFGQAEGPSSHSFVITCVAAGVSQLVLQASGGGYDGINYPGLNVTCLPTFIIVPPQAPGPLSPQSSFTFYLSPSEAPTSLVTLILLSNCSGILDHPARLYFSPYVVTQSQTVQLSYSVGRADLVCAVSVTSSGGNYEGVHVPASLVLRLTSPALIVLATSIDVQPNSISLIPVKLNTLPNATVTVAAMSSDPAIAKVVGSVFISDTDIHFIQIAHVSVGRCQVSFSLTAADASTFFYAPAPSAVVQVRSLGPGFLVNVSSLLVTLGDHAYISVSLDSPPNSRTQLMLEPSSSALAVQPSYQFFELGGNQTAVSFRVACSRSEMVTLSLRSRGGIYHDIIVTDIVNVSCLPIPDDHITFSAKTLLGRLMNVSIQLPADVNQLIGFQVQASTSPTFTVVGLDLNLSSTESSVVLGPLVLGSCYFLRVRPTRLRGPGQWTGSENCSDVIDYPSRVLNLRLELISDYLIRVDWDPPTSRGQVNPLAPLSYQVAMLDTNGTILSSTYTESTTIVQQVLKSKGQSSLEIRVGAITDLSPTVYQTASVYVTLLAQQVLYNVPLELYLSATQVTSAVASLSSIVVTPRSAPQVDAVLQIVSSNPDSVEALLPIIILKAGSLLPQTILLQHKIKGLSVVDVVPAGGNYNFPNGSAIMVLTNASPA
ncbi:hypothetical protein GUITHDRAFT_134499 [Guillardia theta CCMP2712]|uniref:IPT/TIG domain-containing protein n=1 Tax=Guillardia theta (strain CCMP2712) TaxID=905079 RepID=L1JU31_GUITC|nr:hypothetical protein GUITHDRAFT_134499 [Guillardia theta CCMP2712]EKX51598.1 hypothetical protein GUITHDRAFT_134499 [Guillardia theta CCMP2712]|eukprot:XP_005838578.1 hypothetical protein GUITHDRAFT_134499 [Guillardia theta CCMP2712]